MIDPGGREEGGEGVQKESLLDGVALVPSGEARATETHSAFDASAFADAQKAALAQTSPEVERHLRHWALVEDGNRLLQSFDQFGAASVANARANGHAKAILHNLYGTDEVTRLLGSGASAKSGKEILEHTLYTTQKLLSFTPEQEKERDAFVEGVFGSDKSREWDGLRNTPGVTRQELHAFAKEKFQPSGVGEFLRSSGSWEDTSDDERKVFGAPVKPERYGTIIQGGGHTQRIGTGVGGLGIQSYADVKYRRQQDIAYDKEMAAWHKANKEAINEQRLIDKYDQEFALERKVQILAKAAPYVSEQALKLIQSAAVAGDSTKQNFRSAILMLPEDEQGIAMTLMSAVRPYDFEGDWSGAGARFLQGGANLGRGAVRGVSTAWHALFDSEEEARRYEKGVKFDTQFHELVDKWSVKKPDTFTGEMIQGLAESAPYMLAVGASMWLTGGASGAAGVLGKGAMVAGHVGQTLIVSSYAGNISDELITNGVPVGQAAAVGWVAGIPAYMIERLQVMDFVSPSLSAETVRQVGGRAIARALASGNRQAIAGVLGANAKSFAHVVVTETLEELAQELVEQGTITAHEKDMTVARWMNTMGAKTADTFSEIMPTMVGFGLTGAGFHGLSRRSADAEFTGKLNGLVADMANASAIQGESKLMVERSRDRERSRIWNKVNEVIHATEGMDSGEAAAFISGLDAGKAEKAFYETMISAYRADARLYGEEGAGARFSGTIDFKALEKAGFVFTRNQKWRVTQMRQGNVEADVVYADDVDGQGGHLKIDVSDEAVAASLDDKTMLMRISDAEAALEASGGVAKEGVQEKLNILRSLHGKNFEEKVEVYKRLSEEERQLAGIDKSSLTPKGAFLAQGSEIGILNRDGSRGRKRFNRDTLLLMNLLGYIQADTGTVIHEAGHSMTDAARVNVEDVNAALEVEYQTGNAAANEEAFVEEVRERLQKTLGMPSLKLGGTSSLAMLDNFWKTLVRVAIVGRIKPDYSSVVSNDAVIYGEGKAIAAQNVLNALLGEAQGKLTTQRAEEEAAFRKAVDDSLRQAAVLNPEIEASAREVAGVLGLSMEEVTTSPVALIEKLREVGGWVALDGGVMSGKSALPDAEAVRVREAVGHLADLVGRAYAEQVALPDVMRDEFGRLFAAALKEAVTQRDTELGQAFGAVLREEGESRLLSQEAASIAALPAEERADLLKRSAALVGQRVLLRHPDLMTEAEYNALMHEVSLGEAVRRGGEKTAAEANKAAVRGLEKAQKALEEAEASGNQKRIRKAGRAVKEAEKRVETTRRALARFDGSIAKELAVADEHKRYADEMAALKESRDKQAKVIETRGPGQRMTDGNYPVLERLDGGRLVSATALQKRRNGHANIGGEYDGAPGMRELGYVASRIYGKHGSAPDQVAQELYNEGLLSEPSPDVLFNAIRGEAKSLANAIASEVDYLDFEMDQTLEDAAAQHEAALADLEGDNGIRFQLSTGNEEALADALMQAAGLAHNPRNDTLEMREVRKQYTRPDGSMKPGWMKAPNGQPTKLNARQWLQVRTPAFKRWFGDWLTLAKISAAQAIEAKVYDKAEPVTKAEAKAIFQ